MPDIDIDFCDDRRQEVIDYVNEKYGADHVSQIIAFSTMKAKGVIRDVGRALAIPYGEVDRIAKMVPFDPKGMTLERAFELNSELKREYESDERTKRLIDISRRLEGLTRHASTHATAVVICDRPVDEYIPLQVNGDVVTTQFPYATIEELGLLKMDLLGLSTLTVIQWTAAEVNRLFDTDINIDELDFADPKVYELISRADTEGVFQLEGSGMKSFMKELKPNRIDDIIAGIALYRPGPMKSIPQYVRNKNGGAVRYAHPLLEPILEGTYGCIVYQEQVTQIFRDLAGYSVSRSDMIRRAVAKKKADVMEEERRNFVHGLGDSVPGCVRNGVPQEIAERIFDDMADFAQYGFNKSHAAGYAVVVYQTAWLKCHYPEEFMAALMTSVMDETAKITTYIQECKKLGVAVLPPDINEGHGQFTVDRAAGGIRFGLSAIKNVGRLAVGAIVNERESGGSYRSLSDFVQRLGDGHVNKRCVESLIKAGAFDSLGGKRSQYLQVYDKLIDGFSTDRKRNVAGQMSLFDFADLGEAEKVYTDDLPDIPEFTLRQRLTDEKAAIGIYISGHPLLEYEEKYRDRITHTSADFLTKRDESDSDNETEEQRRVGDDVDVAVAGIVTAKSIKYTKTNNEPMAFLTLEDLFGTAEALVFPKVYDRYSKLLTNGRALIVFGKTTAREGEDTKVICNDITFLDEDEDAARGLPALWIKIPKAMEMQYENIFDILKRHRGATPVIIYDEKNGRKLNVREEHWVNAGSDALLLSLRNLFGEKSVVVK